MNASGTVIAVTASATHSVFQIDCAQRGRAEVLAKLRRPTNAPSLSCTLFTRIVDQRRRAGTTPAPRSTATQQRPARAGPASARCGVTAGDGERRGSAARRASPSAAQPSTRIAAGGSAHGRPARPARGRRRRPRGAARWRPAAARRRRRAAMPTRQNAPRNSTLATRAGQRVGARSTRRRSRCTTMSSGRR